MKRLIIFLSCLLALPVVSAQTAPELFVFEAGTPIKASEVNANFQLLRDQITTVIGAGNVTLDDLEDLAGVVEQLQAAFEAGELDGISLEYEWDGTRLGVRQSGEAAYTYVDLRGAVGPMGPVGPVGPAGADGADGKDGVDGVDGAPGADGKDGAPGLDGKDGAQGPAGSPGEKGEPGTPGVDGAPGAPGAPGADGVDGVDGMNGTNGVDGAPGAPGADGADGRTLLNGPGAPSSSLGSDGDFYIDTASWQIYGPKSSGGWSVGASLMGPQGPKGDTGSGGGGLGSVRIDVSAHVTDLGEWNDAHEAEVSCLPGEVLLDVTVSSTPETYIYDWIIGIEQVSATTSVVKVSKDPNNGIPFTLYTKCLGAAS